MIEITDPIEIEALEQRIRAAEKTLAKRDRALQDKSAKTKPRKRNQEAQ